MVFDDCCYQLFLFGQISFARLAFSMKLIVFLTSLMSLPRAMYNDEAILLSFLALSNLRQSRIICLTLVLIPQVLQMDSVSFRAKWPWVALVCPILSRVMMRLSFLLSNTKIQPPGWNPRSKPRNLQWSHHDREENPISGVKRNEILTPQTHIYRRLKNPPRNRMWNLYTRHWNQHKSTIALIYIQCWSVRNQQSYWPLPLNPLCYLHRLKKRTNGHQKSRYKSPLDSWHQK